MMKTKVAKNPLATTGRQMLLREWDCVGTPTRRAAVLSPPRGAPERSQGGGACAVNQRVVSPPAQRGCRAGRASRGRTRCGGRDASALADAGNAPHGRIAPCVSPLRAIWARARARYARSRPPDAPGQALRRGGARARLARRGGETQRTNAPTHPPAPHRTRTAPARTSNRRAHGADDVEVHRGKQPHEDVGTSTISEYPGEMSLERRGEAGAA